MENNTLNVINRIVYLWIIQGIYYLIINYNNFTKKSQVKFLQSNWLVLSQKSVFPSSKLKSNNSLSDKHQAHCFFTIPLHALDDRMYSK